MSGEAVYGRVADVLKGFGMSEEFWSFAIGRSFEQVWSDCERGDQMAALLTACGFDRKKLTLVAVACAEPVLGQVKGIDVCSDERHWVCQELGVWDGAN